MAQEHEEDCGTVMIRISAVIGILACLGNISMVYLLGTWDPGYSPLLQAMSDLGHKGSPVARIVSMGWVIMGLMFILFGYGFYRTFLRYAQTARTAGWMLALYGMGEGLGSGLIPGSPGKVFQTRGSVFHTLVSAVGVWAAVLLPFIIVKMFNAWKSSALRRYCWFTTFAGVLFLTLFLISNLYHPEGNWISCLGLWQRVYTLIYYFFFIFLALLMLASKYRPWERSAGKL
jgi:hypothetical membrane protein